MFTELLHLLSLHTVLLGMAGIIAGMITGVLPGIGPATAMSVLFPFTFYMAPEQALITLAGIYYGSQYGDNISATTMRLASGASIVICEDGYAMAQKGRASQSLFLGAISTIIAGLISLTFVALVAQPVSDLALNFGSPEYAALIFMGLTISIFSIPNSSPIASAALMFFGYVLGTVGIDINTGEEHLTFGIEYLIDGIPLAIFVTGLFGISEVIWQLYSKNAEAFAVQKVSFISFAEFKKVLPSIFRGTALGGLIGLLPGGSSIWSSFASHGLEKQLSDDHEPAVAGPSAASESSVNSGFIPLLTLGIPENPAMALLLGSLLVHGFRPGPEFIAEQQPLFWMFLASILIGNILLFVMNVFGIRFWVKILEIPKHTLYTSIVLICIFGSYFLRNNPYDIIAAFGIGFLGFGLKTAKLNLLPMATGFILGPMLEDRIAKTLVISDSDWTVFFTRPLSASLVGITIIIVLSILFIRYRYNK